MYKYRPRDRLRVFILLFKGNFEAVVSCERCTVPHNALLYPSVSSHLTNVCQNDPTTENTVRQNLQKCRVMSDVTGLTDDGRMFHVRQAATRNVRSVDRLTARVSVSVSTHALPFVVKGITILYIRFHCNKYVRLRGRPYIHTCRSYAWSVRTPASPAPWLAGQPWRGRCRRFESDFGLLGSFWGAKFPKMRDSLP